MTQLRMGKLLAAVMALLFPLSVVATDARGALVYATNGVSVNGTSIQRSGALLSGDQVQVPSQSAVAITAPGNQIVLAAGSKLTYAAGSVALDDGSGVAVTTTKGFAVKADKVTVKPPAGNTAKYEVARAGGEVTVRALDGPVQVYDGTSSLMTVAEGKTTTIPDPAPQQQTNSKRSAPPVAGGGTLSMGDLILMGAAAGGFTAIVLLTTQGSFVSAPPSPSRP